MAVAPVKGMNAALLTRVIVSSFALSAATAYTWWFTGHKANVEPMSTYYKKQALTK